MTRKRPNILFIITDHHAYYDHNRPGEFEFAPPVFERFCAEGVRFDRAYSVSPICSPARASMMTGVYPSVHGLRWNTEGIRMPGNRADFASGTRLYSHFLSREGYRNGYVGKWHCGHERLPVDFGIEGWSLPDYGKIYMSDAYAAYASERGLGDARARIEHNLNHPEWNGQTLVLHHPSPWRFMNGSGVLEGPPEAHEEFFVAHLAVEKMKELARAGNETGQPWSLVASFWGPHQPYFPTEPYAGTIDPKGIPPYPSFDDDLEGRPLRYFIHRDLTHGPPRLHWPEWSIWQEVVRRCYEQELQLDAAVGKVLDALEETGVAGETLVIWLADHGDALASHGGVWDKASTFTEEVARVPMAIRWPLEISAGARTERLVSNMDATATILDAAGVTVPQTFQSRSVLPLCRDPEGAEWPDQVVCEHNGHGDDILQRIVVTDRYKYVAALFDGDELYDLKEDPHEMRNLVQSGEHAGVCEEMRARLIEHIERTKDRIARKLLYALRRGPVGQQRLQQG